MSADETVSASQDDERFLQNIDQLHRLAADTQNPVFAWQALLSCLWRAPIGRQPDELPVDVVIPGWIAKYLTAIAEGISHLSAGLDPRSIPDAFDEPAAWERWGRERIKPPAAAASLPSVLGLIEGTRNLFADYQQKIGDAHLFYSQQALIAKGLKVAEANAALAKANRADCERSVRRRIAAGKKIAQPTGVGREDKATTVVPSGQE